MHEIALIQEGRPDQGSSCEMKVMKLSDSKRSLKAKPTRFLNVLNIGCENQSRVIQGMGHYSRPYAVVGRPLLASENLFIGMTLSQSSQIPFTLAGWGATSHSPVMVHPHFLVYRLLGLEFMTDMWITRLDQELEGSALKLTWELASPAPASPGRPSWSNKTLAFGSLPPSQS